MMNIPWVFSLKHWQQSLGSFVSPLFFMIAPRVLKPQTPAAKPWLFLFSPKYLTMNRSAGSQASNAGGEALAFLSITFQNGG